MKNLLLIFSLLILVSCSEPPPPKELTIKEKNRQAYETWKKSADKASGEDDLPMFDITVTSWDEREETPYLYQGVRRETMGQLDDRAQRLAITPDEHGNAQTIRIHITPEADEKDVLALIDMLSKYKHTKILFLEAVPQVGN